MIRTLRSLLIYTSLACYGVAAFVGQGLHEWTGCEHASSASACCEATPAHDDHADHQHSQHKHSRRGHVCRHHHGASPASAVAQKSESPGKTSPSSKTKRGDGWNAPRHAHDHHSCLICQFQAQSQLVVATADTGHSPAIVVSPVYETLQFFSAQDHEPYAPRGPPLAV